MPTNSPTPPVLAALHRPAHEISICREMMTILSRFQHSMSLYLFAVIMLQVGEDPPLRSRAGC